MSDKGCDANKIIWAMSLVILAAIIAGTIYYGGIFSDPGKRLNRVRIIATTTQ